MKIQVLNNVWQPEIMNHVMNSLNVLNFEQESLFNNASVVEKLYQNFPRYSSVVHAFNWEF